MKLQANSLFTSQGLLLNDRQLLKVNYLRKVQIVTQKNIKRLTVTPAKQSFELPPVQQMERFQITEKIKTGKIIRMFGVERLNNIEEDKKAKVKVLTSEILVAIHDKPGSKNFKTYLVLIDSGTSSCLMDKHLASINGVDANATLSKERWLTQCRVFKTTARVTLDKPPQFTIKRTMTAEMNLFGRAKGDPYGFILGRNFLQYIKLDIKTAHKPLPWTKSKYQWSQEDIGIKPALVTSGRLT